MSLLHSSPLFPTYLPVLIPKFVVGKYLWFGRPSKTIYVSAEKGTHISIFCHATPMEQASKAMYSLVLKLQPSSPTFILSQKAGKHPTPSAFATHRKNRQHSQDHNASLVRKTCCFNAVIFLVRTASIYLGYS